MNYIQFHQAIKQNKFELFKNFLPIFFNEHNAVSEYDLLSFCIFENRPEMAKFIMDNNYQFDAYQAIKNCLYLTHFSLIDYILDKSTTFTQEQINDLLLFSAQLHNKKYFEIFLDLGANLNTLNSMDESCLDVCVKVMNDNMDFFNYLISIGLKPNEKKHITIKNAIIFSHNIEIIKYLFDHTKTKPIFDKNFAKCCLEASLEPNIIELLIKKGMKLDKWCPLYVYFCKYYHFGDYEKQQLLSLIEVFKNNHIAMPTLSMSNVSVQCFKKTVNPNCQHKIYLTLLEYLLNCGEKLPNNKIAYLLNKSDAQNLLSFASDTQINEVIADYLNKTMFFFSSEEFFINVLNLNFNLSNNNFLNILCHANEKVFKQAIQSKYYQPSKTCYLFALALNGNNFTDNTLIELMENYPNTNNINQLSADSINILFYLKKEALIEKALCLGANQHHLDPKGCNLLHYSHMTPALVDFWVSKGLDINENYDKLGYSSIFNHLKPSTLDSSLELIKCFLNHGAKVNIKTLESRMDKYQFTKIKDFAILTQEKIKLEESLNLKKLHTSKSISKI